MDASCTAVVKEDAGWWIGWIEEVPGVNCKEATREELVNSLQVTLREALELNRTEAMEVLLAHGADPNARTRIDHYATPLEEVEILGREKSAAFLRKLAAQNT